MTNPLAPSSEPWSVEEFLNWEAQQTERWELIEGHPWRMMAGGTVAHALVIGNVFRALDRTLAGGACRVFAETLKVRTRARVYYPDVFVHCGPRDLNATVLDDPRLVVEVVSPSTEKADLGEKRAEYLAVAGLVGYVVITTHPRLIRLFTPEAEPIEGQRASAPGEAVMIAGLGVSLTYEAVFDGLDTPAND
jgi:Uma2 family endonuclease